MVNVGCEGDGGVPVYPSIALWVERSGSAQIGGRRFLGSPNRGRLKSNCVNALTRETRGATSMPGPTDHRDRGS